MASPGTVPYRMVSLIALGGTPMEPEQLPPLVISRFPEKKKERQTKKLSINLILEKSYDILL